MFYLPRLFAYHADVAPGSQQDLLFQTMERRLLRIIINPAMIATLIFGVLLADIYGWQSLGIWFHLKISLVILMTVVHGLLSRWRKDFVKGQNKHSAKFYRLVNEIPTVLFILIVILVIIKPFE